MTNAERFGNNSKADKGLQLWIEIPPHQHLERGRPVRVQLITYDAGSVRVSKPHSR
jgi:hypothetical protein